MSAYYFLLISSLYRRIAIVFYVFILGAQQPYIGA